LTLTNLFISYTGLLEPLGASQVVPYVRGLSQKGHSMRILSFEKARRGDGELERTRGALREDGIEWRWLPYHKRPPVLSTMRDVVAGFLAARAVLEGVRLVHARSHVPALIAYALQKRYGVPFLFDHRGRMADEYADAGIWPAGGVLYRATERWEQRFIRAAAGVVVLTQRLQEEIGTGPNRVTVIPCAVDLARFHPRADDVPAEFDLVYAGSWSGLYLSTEILRFHEAYRRLRPGARLLVLVPRPTEAVAGAAGVEVRVAAPEEVPAFLRRARAGLSLRRPGRAQVAASPVKVSEYLASGLPVVTSAGVGDLDRLVPEDRVGVVLRGFSDDDLQAAARALIALQQEGDALASRCRRLAEDRYDLDQAIRAYDHVYNAILGGSPDEGGHSSRR
jgi:glycosyltransferase involved in cell wall biosynthesis